MPDSDIAKTVAAIVALGLALQASLGPSIMQVTDAVKAALKLPDGWGGVIALLTGIMLGVGVGAVTAATTSANYYTSIGFGALAGVLVGAGAVKEYKAAGATNTQMSAAINRRSAFPFSTTTMTYSDGYADGHEAGLSAANNGMITDGDPAADYQVIEDPGNTDEHTGQAIEVPPKDNLPDPTHDYTGQPTDIPSQATGEAANAEDTLANQPGNTNG